MVEELPGFIAAPAIVILIMMAGFVYRRDLAVWLGLAERNRHER